MGCAGTLIFLMLRGLTLRDALNGGGGGGERVRLFNGMAQHVCGRRLAETSLTYHECTFLSSFKQQNPVVKVAVECVVSCH